MSEDVALRLAPEAIFSPRQLIQRRFLKHRLAVFSAFVLFWFYFISFFAPFFAPNSPHEVDTRWTHMPPMVPKFSLEHGLHLTGWEVERDSYTRRQLYRPDPDKVIPLQFFGKGHEYQILGISFDRHFLTPAPSAYSDTQFHFMGTDGLGRDVFSRILYGSRVSLSVGLVSILISTLLGVAIGGISGFYGGRVDEIIQRSIEVFNSFPQIPLWLALAAVIPAAWPPLWVYFSLTVMLAFLNWTSLARVVRGKVLSVRNSDYVTAAVLLGGSEKRIIGKHLLPAVTSHVIVTLTLAIPAIILGETALSFLGLGLRPPTVSWGVLLQDSMNLEALRFYPWLMAPLIPVMVTVLSFNFLGDGLRDAFDPYS